MISKNPEDNAGIELLQEKHIRNEKILTQAYISIKEKETALKKLNKELNSSKEKLQQQLEFIKKTQKALVEKEKMAALGRLVAGIAHEVNTPIGNSYTLITLLQEHFRECQTEYLGGSLDQKCLEKFLSENSEILTMTAENIQRAANLIKKFKLLAVDQSRDDIREFNLLEYSNSVILSLQSLLVDNRHNVELICDPDITLIANPGYYAQILSNVVQNATIHAFNPGQAGNILIKIFQKENLIYIQVSDDGRGISPEIISHIFDPFFTTNRGSGGSGLGLNIVYNLVNQKFGGRISCNSKLEEGCLIEIVIPSGVNRKALQPEDVY